MFDYEPLSEDELFGLLPEGTYDFRVQSALPKVSGSASKNPGSKMILVTLEIRQGGIGRAYEVEDYLMGGKMLYKFKHFCDATGLEQEYEAKTITPNLLIGRTGKVYLIRKEAEGKFLPKNEVRDYVKRDGLNPEATKQAVAAQPTNDFVDSDIPF
jgi:hypothetical protein